MTIPISRINGLPRFHPLTDASKAILSRLLIEKNFDTGATVIRQGQAAGAFLIIESGYVKWEREAAHGVASLMDVYGACEAPGESALRQGGAYPAAAVALTATTALLLNREAYDSLIATDPAFAARTLHCFASRSNSLWGKVEADSLPSVEHRLAAILFRLVLKFGQREKTDRWSLPFPLSRRELALAANCRRETATRLMRRWELRNEVRAMDGGFEISADFVAALEAQYGSYHSYFGSECARCKKLIFG